MKAKKRFTVTNEAYYFLENVTIPDPLIEKEIYLSFDSDDQTLAADGSFKYDGGISIVWYRVAPKMPQLRVFCSNLSLLDEIKDLMVFLSSNEYLSLEEVKTFLKASRYKDTTERSKRKRKLFDLIEKAKKNK